MESEERVIKKIQTEREERRRTNVFCSDNRLRGEELHNYDTTSGGCSPADRKDGDLMMLMRMVMIIVM